MSTPRKTTARIVPKIAVSANLHKVNKGAATTVSARKRAAKKLREKAATNDKFQPIQRQLETVTEQIQPNEAQEDQDLLTEDRRRSNAELHLLNITMALPHACHISQQRLQEMTDLFAKKDTLPTTKEERDQDDHARRNAVYEIMQARENCLWEHKGEAMRWIVTASPKSDIRAALVQKFNSRANSMTAVSSQHIGLIVGMLIRRTFRTAPR